MDRQRLRARLRRLPAARRPRRRPARPQAAVPDRPRHLHDRVAPGRALRELRDADRVARAAGLRRGADLARGAVDHLDHLRRRQGTLPRARRLGGDRDRRFGGRPHPRRLPHAGVLVAVDLLRQRPGRHRRLRALAAPHSRVAGRARGAGLRHRRRGDRDRRPDDARLRDRQGRRRTGGRRRRRSASSRCRPCCCRRSW